MKRAYVDYTEVKDTGKYVVYLNGSKVGFYYTEKAAQLYCHELNKQV